MTCAYLTLSLSSLDEQSAKEKGRARGRPTQSTRGLIVALVDGLWAYQGSLIFFMGPLGTKIRQI